METLVINIPEKKSALVKQLLKELGVKISDPSQSVDTTVQHPNKKTIKTIEDARKGLGLNEPIKDVHSFIKSL